MLQPIAFNLNRRMVPVQRVNPLQTAKQEQTQTFDGTASVNQITCDLLLHQRRHPRTENLLPDRRRKEKARRGQLPG